MFLDPDFLKPWTDFDQTWQGWYIRDPTPHDNFGGGSSTWVGKYVTCQISEFLFFFLFCFLCHAPRSHFLTDRDDVYAKMCVFGQGCAFWESWQYLTNLGIKHPKTSPKWMGIRIFKHKRQKWKIHISHKHVNRLTQNFQLFFGPPTVQRGFVGGLAALYYKSKMAADTILDFR